jgi:hypothetical protein
MVEWNSFNTLGTVGGAKDSGGRGTEIGFTNKRDIHVMSTYKLKFSAQERP